MAMTDARLPCGHDPEVLYEHLRSDGLDEHERTCPSCQAETDRLAAAARAVSGLAAEQPAPPPGFVRSVMTRVRADPRRRRYLSLGAEPPATVAISENAAAALLSAAASGVPGLTVRGWAFPVPGDIRHVTVTVSIRFGTDAGAVDQLRAAVRRAGLAQLGADITVIDVEITDVDSAE